MTNAQKLKSWLKNSGMTQVFFAGKIGVTPDRLRKWMAGDSTPIPHFRQRIEELTGGEVKAGEW